MQIKHIGRAVACLIFLVWTGWFFRPDHYYIDRHVADVDRLGYLIFSALYWVLYWAFFEVKRYRAGR